MLLLTEFKEKLISVVVFCVDSLAASIDFFCRFHLVLSYFDFDHNTRKLKRKGATTQRSDTLLQIKLRLVRINNVLGTVRFLYGFPGAKPFRDLRETGPWCVYFRQVFVFRARLFYGSRSVTTK